MTSRPRAGKLFPRGPHDGGEALLLKTPPGSRWRLRVAGKVAPGRVEQGTVGLMTVSDGGVTGDEAEVEPALASGGGL